MENTILISDTLSKKKKTLFLSSEEINLYVCGITPYDDAHIGHGRCYVTYDILVRLIRYYNCKVTYVRNITDVNDKLNEKAITRFNDPKKFKEIAEEYYLKFKDMMQQLGCIDADYSPKVTESIEDIISLIEKIIAENHAYITDDGVYFAVDSFSKYGELSNRHFVEQNNTISRLNDQHEKKNQLDFVLWKKIDDAPFWHSPWGKGRPGWHIECSAMIKKSFGLKTIDIHGGGIDLIFPHHENERAQTECCQKNTLTKIWMHIAPINKDKQKMSKSLGNSVALKDIFMTVHPMVLRFYFLMHNYNCPMEFNFNILNGAKKSYIQLITLFKENNNYSNSTNPLEKDILEKAHTLLLDDLNTAEVIGLFFKYKKIITTSFFLKAELKKMCQFILGLSLDEPHIQALNTEEKIYNDEIKQLIEERAIARKKKDFLTADRIRNILVKKGYILKDEKIN